LKIKQSKTSPGADINSSHNLVIMLTQLKYKKIKKGGIYKKWNLEIFKEDEKRIECIEKCEKAFSSLQIDNSFSGK